MDATAVLRPSPIELRPTKEVKRGLGYAFLFALVVGLAAWLSPHDPSECGEPPHIENSDVPKLPPLIITPTVSPHAFDISNGCGPKYNTGDFKLH